MLALAAARLCLLLTVAPLGAGSPAPAAFEIDTLNGGRQLVELRGQITIVDFFATWCPRCRESAGSYEQLVRAFGDQLRVVVVDVEEDPATVLGYFARHPLPGSVTIGLDFTGKVYRAFGGGGFPTFVMIDERGVVQYRSSGWGADTAAHLAKWVDYLIKKRDANTTAAATAAAPARKRRGRAKASAASQAAPAPRSADEHARSMGVEILR